MASYRLSRWEMETTVNFNAEEKKAILYTRDKSVMRRLDKLVAEFPDIYKCIKKTDIDKTYEYPKKYSIPRRPRILSEEQREKSRDRLKKAREKQQTDVDGIDAEILEELLDEEEDFEDDSIEDEFIEDADETEDEDGE